jgi:hypothetical protein
VKNINLGLSERLHGKIKAYADTREIPVVGVIRMVLSDFFRNKHFDVKSNEELPEGIVDMGEGKGYAIDMEYLVDSRGIAHPPPPHLTKQQTLEWIRKHHNGKKSEA